MKLKSVVKKIVKATRKKEIIAVETPIAEKEILKNKVALITGGSGGIGLAIAKSFYESGCNLILAGTNENKLKHCKENFGNQDSVKTVLFDMSDPDSFDMIIEKSVRFFGKIDILVNSAGVHTNNLEFGRVSIEEYDRIMNINLRGPYFLSIRIAQYWKKTNVKGHILFISSSRGSEPAWSPYGLSKWGINGMTKGLAQLLIKDGIVVNAIAPGSTATPLLGINEGESIYTEENYLGRMALPVEIGTFARLLVSETGDMLTGETIHISGGRGVFDIR